MATALDRAKLARAARALNASRRANTLPALILMTDRERLPDPLSAARALPRGSAVIVRHTDPRARAEVARALAATARTCGLLLLVAGDPHLAIAVGADGLHLPEARAGEAAHWRAMRLDWLISAAAHSLRGLSIASRAGADAALLAPVFATPSHPDRQPLGAVRAGLIARRAPLPVYALGGVNAGTVLALEGSTFAGVAAIDALRPG
jgi:thiamine-phosphate pyrophosphorylase